LTRKKRQSNAVLSEGGTSQLPGIFTNSQKATKKIRIKNEVFDVSYVADFDSIFEMKTEQELNETCLFGGVVWPSSIALCNWVAECCETQAGTSEHFQEVLKAIEDPACQILELGCGVGLAGIYLSKVLARNALLTDFEDSLFEMVMANALSMKNESHVSCSLLNWKDDSLPLSVKERKIGLIVATDVLYEHEHITLVPTIAARIMKATGAKLFILADPERYCYESALDMLHQTFANVSRKSFIHDEAGTSKKDTTVQIHFCSSPK
jgi:predicted nicotinamide N-methyase